MSRCPSCIRRGALAGIADRWINTVGCSEYTILLVQIEEALGVAQRAGVTSTLAYSRAKTLYDKEMSFFGRTVLATPTDCKNGVAYATAVRDALLATIPAAQSEIVIVNPDKPQTTGDYLSAIKFVAGAVIVVGGLYVAGPLLRSLLSPKKALNGYRKRRR